MLYSKDHLWIQYKGAIAYIGITAFLQQKMGTVFFSHFYSSNQVLNESSLFAILASRKATNLLFMPVSGKILETNIELSKQSNLLNSEQLNKRWFVKIAPTSPDEKLNLLTGEEYDNFLLQQMSNKY